MQIKETKYFILDKPTKKFRPRGEIKYFLKSIYLKLYIHLFAPRYQEKKYKVSICAIFKNEAKYLKEWIEFHKIIGIEHFYLYNNFSADNYKEVLRPYIEDNTVTLIDWAIPQGQMAAYKDCLKKHCTETEWLGFIDIDEFVVPKKDNSICDFLAKFRKYPSVQLYWRLFGTSGKIKRDTNRLVTEDFVVCWNKYDGIGKCFANTSYAFDENSPHNNVLHHSIWGKLKKRSIPPVNHDKRFLMTNFHKVKDNDFSAQINHYFTKSLEEYAEKSSKGDVFFLSNPHNLDYFYRHEMLCTATDYSAYRYLIKLKNAMKLEE